MTVDGKRGAESRRPAHRPSRRTAVVSAATRLFAMRGIETVTVADIADEAGMTPAAVYYHFPSKIEILLESMRAFSEALVAELDRRVDAMTPDHNPVGQLVTDLIGWLDERRPEATVYFVSSSGANLAAEALRRATRIEQMGLLIRAVRAAQPPGRRMRGADAGVIATGLLSLIETAAASWLAEDAVLEGLGQRRFLRATADLAKRILQG